MLDYTKAALRQTAADLKRADFIRNVVTQAVYILYLIYTLVAKTGILAVNILLLTLAASYFVFFLVMTSFGKTPDGKKVKKRVTRIYVWCRRLIKLFTLGVMIYGIGTAATHTSVFSLILAALMIVGWILQIVFEVLIKIVVKRVNLIVEGLEADLDGLLKPARAVGNFFKKVTGKEVTPPKEPTQNRLKLKEKVEEYRAEQARRKEEERLAALARREEEKQAAKDEKKSIRAEKKLLKRVRGKNSDAKRNADGNAAPQTNLLLSEVGTPDKTGYGAETDESRRETALAATTEQTERRSRFSHGRTKNHADSLPALPESSETDDLTDVFGEEIVQRTDDDFYGDGKERDETNGAPAVLPEKDKKKSSFRFFKKK